MNEKWKIMVIITILFIGCMIAGCTEKDESNDR